MQLDEAIKEILKGNSILFLGAGFSVEAVNLKNKNLLTATELSYYLCEQLNLERDDELEYTSEQYIERFGINKIISELKDLYTATQTTSSQKTIINLPWKRIYTTNYDNVIKKASIDSIDVATLSENPKIYYNKNKLCVYLNGYVERLSEGTINNEFKLTTKSYLTDDFTFSPWLDMFREDVKNCKSIFFIGCSLNYDLDIKRILCGIPNLNRKCYFITIKSISEKTENKMMNFGDVIKYGIDGFASDIIKISERFTVEDTEKEEFFDFELFENTILPIADIKDDDIFNLFIKGQYIQENIKATLNLINQKKYMVKRTHIKNIINCFNRGKKLVIIHSDLGNGKTGLIQLLKFELCEYGKVFELKKESNLTVLDFEKIANLNEKVFIIIESYNLYLNLINKFRVFMNDNIKFVMTSRTLSNDVNYAELVKRLEFNNADVEVYSMNRLNDKEIEDLIDIFDEYSLWGKNSRDNRITKKKVFEKLHNNFQSILLNIDSDYIKNQLYKIVQSIKEETSYYRVIMLVLLNEVMEHILELDDLVYLLDSSLLYNQSFLRDPLIGEIIDFNSYCPVIKSSIVAKYVLEQASNSSALISVLIDILKKADKKTYITKYRNLFRYLVSFSNIRYLLYYDKTNFNDLIITYYENIKNLNYNKQNSFFWLQYAIARLELKEYHKAKIYFDNAYSYCKNISGFDTIQIDTHYARYIFENQIFAGDDRDAFVNFRQAHGIIMKKREIQHLHYPLRRTNIYYEYYQKYFCKFNDIEKVYFIDACSKAKEKIEKYFINIDLEHRRRDHLVIECHRKLALIIKETEDFYKAIKEVAASNNIK